MAFERVGPKIRAFVDSVVLRCMTECIKWDGTGSGMCGRHEPAPTTVAEFLDAAAHLVADALDLYCREHLDHVQKHVNLIECWHNDPNFDYIEFFGDPDSIFCEVECDDDLRHHVLAFAPVLECMDFDSIMAFLELSEEFVQEVLPELVD
jgi:hypothetical protein